MRNKAAVGRIISLQITNIKKNCLGNIMSSSNEKYGCCRRDNAKYWSPIFVLSALLTLFVPLSILLGNEFSFTFTYMFLKQISFVISFPTKERPGRRSAWSSQFHHPNCLTWHGPVALFDTHVFLLNEYFIELNTANFDILNKVLN